MSLKLSTSGLSRRRYLSIVGGASASTALVGQVSADEEYDRVVDIVEAGADNTGEEPIDEVFEEEAQDDTLLKFPPGTYLANELILYELSNFAMVGEDATLVPGDDYSQETWLAGGDTRNIRIENFTIDNTEEGVGPEIHITAYDSLVFRNVHKKGSHDTNGMAFGFRMLNEDSRGLVENVTAPDGGTAVGMWTDTKGPMTFRNCHIERFTDNGLYASSAEAPVTVEGGFFRNNNIAQVRLGSEDSSVEGATMVATESVTGPDSDVANMRGVRVADGPGPVTVSDCDIRMENTQGTGGIVCAYSGGSLRVRGTRIYVGPDYTTVGSDGSRGSFGILVDEATDAPTGDRVIEDTAITGGGTYRSAMLFRRDNNLVQDLCIEQSGKGRNGIIFNGSENNEVTNSGIEVPSDPIVLRDSKATVANVDQSAHCPQPETERNDSDDTEEQQDSTSSDTTDSDGSTTDDSEEAGLESSSNTATTSGSRSEADSDTTESSTDGDGDGCPKT